MRSIPSWLVRKPLLLGSQLGLVPFASYQLLLYSQAMYFASEKDWETLDVKPRFSNSNAIIESYEWFLSHKDEAHISKNQSVHRSVATGKALKMIKLVLKMIK